MVRIEREYDFKAKDFFDYLEDSLTTEIKKSRNNNLKVSLKSGTRYRLYGKDGKTYTDVVINKFERNHVYGATFTSLGQTENVTYTVDDKAKGCKIVLSEDILGYDSSKHNKLAAAFYDLMYHRSALVALNKLADGVYQMKKKMQKEAQA